MLASTAAFKSFVLRHEQICEVIVVTEPCFAPGSLSHSRFDGESRIGRHFQRTTTSWRFFMLMGEK